MRVMLKHRPQYGCPLGANSIAPYIPKLKTLGFTGLSDKAK